MTVEAQTIIAESSAGRLAREPPRPIRYTSEADGPIPFRRRDREEAPHRQDRYSDTTTSPRTTRSSNFEEPRDGARLDRRPSFESRPASYVQEPDVRGPSQSRSRDYERPSSYLEEQPVPSRDTWASTRPPRNDRGPTTWTRNVDNGDRRAIPQQGRARPTEPEFPGARAREPSPYRKDAPPVHVGRDRFANEGLDTYKRDNGIHRPPNNRKGGSLLERLNLDETPSAGPPPPSSWFEEGAALPEPLLLPERRFERRRRSPFGPADAESGRGSGSGPSITALSPFGAGSWDATAA